MTTAYILVSALLNIFPYMSGNNRQCIQAHQETIAMHLTNGLNQFEVPQLVLISVGFSETHLGCDINEGGNWGAPISRFHRHTAGTPNHAAIALRRSYEVCNHSWVGAISRFRCGLCRCRGTQAGYPIRVQSLMRRLSALTQLPMPANL